MPSEIPGKKAPTKIHKCNALLYLIERLLVKFELERTTSHCVLSDAHSNPVVSARPLLSIISSLARGRWLLVAVTGRNGGSKRNCARFKGSFFWFLALPGGSPSVLLGMTIGPTGLSENERPPFRRFTETIKGPEVKIAQSFV